MRTTAGIITRTLHLHTTFTRRPHDATFCSCGVGRPSLLFLSFGKGRRRGQLRGAGTGIGMGTTTAPSAWSLRKHSSSQRAPWFPGASRSGLGQASGVRHGVTVRCAAANQETCDVVWCVRRIDSMAIFVAGLPNAGLLSARGRGGLWLYMARRCTVGWGMDGRQGWICTSTASLSPQHSQAS